MGLVHVAGCVILEDNSILLLHRRKRDWWELPGGKGRDRETPARAAVREAKEELGCDVEIVRELGGKGFEQDDTGFMYHWFLAKIRKHAVPRVAELDVFDELEFVPFLKVANRPHSPNVENWIAYLEENKGLFE